MQIWFTSKNITVTLETLNQRLPTILKNLEEITTNINSSTAAVNREIQNVSNTVDRFHLVVDNIVDDIKNIAPMAGKVRFFQMIKNTMAIAKGVRVFMDVFLHKK
jgi:ABC-type transporter Mla subunit MlaD